MYVEQDPPDGAGPGFKSARISGEPLNSEAVLPFSLGGETFASIQAFYTCLKLKADHPLRAACAAGDRAALRKARKIRGPTFEFAGAVFEVNSLQHQQLLCAATTAKALAHSEVRKELKRTGDALLYMGFANQALGVAMPFALMVIRYALAQNLKIEVPDVLWTSD